ncbi:succinate dehydrogenase, cytochrome b556 subunit [Lysobacter sp. KIS68-7]|uniref:succinate dehydrogenase, cytochrome b556 subunit n=1 Tax=Lysobacter sp. KIS68-7 TaxID=2904252 RepID=UPI001E55D701|nr:succinate dehydrogenase, cytochrome b556 subunit [Lysobacter sp. KIS68-7]UHQ19208.1 succinate dehydrogenase, cytochrome b556 subunit [Lysobacter sp. KIS68-7]
MATRERPLSPHLQVYSWQITMVMSILHRATGVALAVGAFGLAWWLVSMAAGGETAGRAMACVSSPLGMVVVFLFSLALVYHFLNGIRHLLWDAGRGFDIPSVYKTGYTVAALTVVFTALIWFLALGGH